MIFGSFWGQAEMSKMYKNLHVFVLFRGSGASVRRSKFDVFWKWFWRLLLEAFWEAFWKPKWGPRRAKMRSGRDPKSRRILKTILEAGDEGQNPPERIRNPSVAGEARPVVFVFTKLWMPPGLEHALRHLLRSGRRIQCLRPVPPPCP